MVDNNVEENYSSHDWRKNTHEAIVTNGDNFMPVNTAKVIFKNPRSLQQEEVDLSRLIRVFVNNQTNHRKSIK